MVDDRNSVPQHVTWLLPTNKAVEQIRSSLYESSSLPKRCYESKDQALVGGDWKKSSEPKDKYILDKQTGLQRSVMLIVGERVNITHNIRISPTVFLANGMHGTVQNLYDDDVEIKMADGKVHLVPRITVEVLHLTF